MLAFILKAQLSNQQVKSYHMKGYFEKFHPVQKGTALSKKELTAGTKCIRRVVSLTSPTRKLGCCSNLCYCEVANVMLKTCARTSKETVGLHPYHYHYYYQYHPCSNPL